MPARRSITVAAVAACAALVVGTTVAADSTDRSNELKRAIDGGKAKNVILLIGDGTDDSQITIGRNYLVGAAGRLALDRLPLTGQMTTYAVLEANPSKPDYTPESASTATAWSTGSKTADGRISTTAGTDRDLRNLIDAANDAGLATGNVTTAELTDASPAAPMAHVANRSCQGPQDMAPCPQDKKSAGGPGSIAEQSIDHAVDVLLGGGKARYDQVSDGGPSAGQTVRQQAIAKGYQVVTDKAGLMAAQPGRKLLGLFNAGNMNVEFTGLPAAKPATGPQRCVENQRPPNEPSLDEMTTKAIELLDQAQGAKGKGQAKGRPGFFLQVESAHIDKRSHAGQPCESIGEIQNFDRAVAVALGYASRNPDTLVIVTGDHAHTPQIVEATATPVGFASKLITREGEIMQLSYGTGPTPSSQEHTGSQIRVAAQGPQAANVVGLIDQTELFDIITRALGAS